MHRLLIVGMGVLVVTVCLLAGAAWRLAQGPIDLQWLSNRLKAAFIEDSASVRVSFDGVFLVWEGFHKGVDHPLDVRLSNIVVTDQAGRRLVAAPGAHLTFSLAGLVLGRIVPRAVEVDHARIAVTREAGGAINLGWDQATDDPTDHVSTDLRRFAAQLSRPASSDHGRTVGLFDQMQRAHFRYASVTLRDRGTGLVVGTSEMDLDLIRTGPGQVHGSLMAPLSIGDQKPVLTAEANWAAGSGAGLDVRLTSFRPAAIGNVPSALAFMTRFDVPLSFTATVGFDAAFKPNRMLASIALGQGQIKVGQGSVPVRAGTIALSGTPADIAIDQAHFDVAPTPDGPAEIVDIAGGIVHQSDRLAATGTLTMSQINIADLPRLWPPGVGGGARPWVIEHVTAGSVRHGTVSFAVESDDRLHDIVLTKATGDLDGTNGTFTWIDNIPPVEQTDVHLHLVDPDTLDIHVASARQRIRNGGADLLVKDAQMRITGLSLHDQIAVIRTRIEGPVASALTLLKEPRLHLLSTHPIAIVVGDGDASATLDFQFPLENKLQMDDVRIHADAHLKGVRLPGVAAGQDLNDGIFDLDIDKDGLTLKGQGSVSTVPVIIDGAMNFDPGPPDQIVQKIAVTGQPNAAQLVAAGLPIADFLGGPIPLTAVMIERRGGDGSIAINGDLTLATLAIHSLAWNKPSGTSATASATLLMSHDRLTKIDKIVVRGDGLLLGGSADLADARDRSVTFDTIRLGRTMAHGSVHFATAEPIVAVLKGEQIDLSAKLTEKISDGDKPDAAQAITPGWTLDARFDHAILANGESASNVVAKASGGGQLIALLNVGGTMQPSSDFAIKIESLAGKRHLSVDAKDAGSFLRGLDAIRVMRSGHLTIDGTLNRPFGLQPLIGTALINDVVVGNSPLLGKLLQAITLYGLVDVLRGPGMGFSHIIVPFHYDGTDLGVDAAHAYNSSLGLTANGRIGLASGQASLTGTIVPAYFFNSLLGQLPLIGKLFSPEKGGGIFAARFGVEGQIDNPTITINPVSALTPGFLRGIFGIFDRAPPAAPSTAGQ